MCSLVVKTLRPSSVCSSVLWLYVRGASVCMVCEPWLSKCFVFDLSRFRQGGSVCVCSVLCVSSL